MKPLEWFERELVFGASPGMLPFYLERLEGSIARVQAKIENVPNNVLSIRLNGKWSIKENIAHLTEVDAIALQRIREIMQETSIMSPAVFPLKQDYNLVPIDELVRHFRETRMKNLDTYAGLTKDDLSKTSLHPRLKVKMSAIDLAYFDAEHDDHHLQKISDILKNTVNTNDPANPSTIISTRS
jgi:hypothetical protein